MRALLVDDHVMFTQSLRFLLDDLDPALECCTARSIAEAVTVTGPFDLVLLDYALPDSQGHLGLTRVLAAHEGATVVMLSGDTRPGLVRELVDLGAAGFVSKAADTETLLTALRILLQGGVYLPPEALATPAAAVPPAAADALQALSPRQRDCLMKLIQGKTNKVIARELDLADSTVKTHISAAFKAMGVSNRAEAVFRAASLGLVHTSGG